MSSGEAIAVCAYQQAMFLIADHDWNGLAVLREFYAATPTEGENQ